MSSPKHLTVLGSHGKLNTKDSISRHLERTEGVASCLLTEGLNFLEVYLHWRVLAADETCPLCGHARMKCDQLFQCTGHDEYLIDDVSSVYWVDRRQMVLMLSTGIG
ncbi:hypothetical protein TNCV_2573801 [Trichonephila clavipes]|nr:hypothetical protein TNCV_2573801 [Trichonephila clavipes]